MNNSKQHQRKKQSIPDYIPLEHQCKKCGQIKPISEFYINRASAAQKANVSPHCKACSSILRKAKKDSILKSQKPDKPMGLVYFVLAPEVNRIKIGFTSKPIQFRMSGMLTDCPCKLELLKTVPGTTQDEYDLHRFFRDLNYRREWFHATPELRSFIDELIHFPIELND